MLDVAALIAVADAAHARSSSAVGADVFDIEACAMALAIERFHDARETFAGLVALNARLLTLAGADAEWPTVKSLVAQGTDARLVREWQLVLANGLALAALCTLGDLKTRAAICDNLHRRVVFAAQPQNDATSKARFEQLRLRAATTLLAYADLRDGSALHADFEAVASEAAAHLPYDALELTRWLAERTMTSVFRIAREPDGAAQADHLCDELANRLDRFPDAVAAFKLARGRFDIARAQNNTMAAGEHLQRCERAQRMLGPRRWTTLVTLLRARGTYAVMRAMPHDAERHYREALELAYAIEAPVTHVTNLLMFLGGALIDQQRYADAASG